MRKIMYLCMVLMMVLFQFGGKIQHASAATAAGDLAVCPNSSSVYYLAADGNRYVFQNEHSFFS